MADHGATLRLDATIPRSGTGSIGSLAALTGQMNDLGLDSRGKKSENNLGPIEAQRFRAIIEESAERLELLGLITLDATRRREMPQSRNRKDIFSLMVQQQDLEEKFEGLMVKRQGMRGGNKKKFQSYQAELAELTESIRSSTAAISQNLKDQPTIVGNLNKIQKDRASLQALLTQTMQDLKTETFDYLVQQVNVRAQQERQLRDALLQRERTAENLKRLEQQLDEEFDKFDRDKEERHKEIQELTVQLKHLKKVTSLTYKFDTESATAKSQTLGRLRKNRLDGLKKSIAKLRGEQETDTLVHEKTIDFLEWQKDTLDRLYEQWEQKYNTEYGAKTSYLNDLTFRRDEDKKKLVALQGRQELDTAEKTALAEEAAKRAREEAAKRKLLHMMNLAQCKIRFAWRVYWRRKEKERKRRARLRRIKAAKAKKDAKNRPFVPRSQRDNKKEAE